MWFELAHFLDSNDITESVFWKVAVAGHPASFRRVISQVGPGCGWRGREFRVGYPQRRPWACRTLRMRTDLLISLASCLLVVNAEVIGRCALAKILHKEHMDGFEGYTLNEWLCLAFVESNFNISKVHENADGSYDYGIFQINSHYWCNDYKSHSENFCHMDCTDILDPNLLSAMQCAKKIVSGSSGMKNWIQWILHCSGRPLSHWMTGCHVE